MPTEPGRESSAVVRPQPMGTATYTASSRLQAAGLFTAMELFEQAARVVPLPPAPQPIAIADYGSADGYNSLLPIGAAITTVRRRTRPDHAILVAHTDRPGNDFTALFTTIAEDPDSYLHKDRATFPSAVGRSFYQQILPSASIALGWSAWATHWLSRVPAPIDDHIHIAHSTNQETRRAYAHQAAVDWHDFLAFRGREIAPGGRLVVLTLTLDRSGHAGFEGVVDALLEGLEQQVDSGLVRPEERRQMVIPTVGRTEGDFMAPFAPSGRFEGLSVERLEMFEAPDRFWARYQVDGNAAAFGAAWAGFARAVIFPALVAAVSTEDGRRAAVIDQLEAQVASRLSAQPCPNVIPLAALVAVKVPR